MGPGSHDPQRGQRPPGRGRRALRRARDAGRDRGAAPAVRRRGCSPRGARQPLAAGDPRGARRGQPGDPRRDPRRAAHVPELRHDDDARAAPARPVLEGAGRPTPGGRRARVAAHTFPYFVPVGSPLGREVVVDGVPKLMFGSNNYLGLADDPRVADAAKRGGGPVRQRLHRVPADERDARPAPGAGARARGLDATGGRARLHRRLPGQPRDDRHALWPRRRDRHRREEPRVDRGRGAALRAHGSCESATTISTSSRPSSVASRRTVAPHSSSGTPCSRWRATSSTCRGCSRSAVRPGRAHSSTRRTHSGCSAPKVVACRSGSIPVPTSSWAPSASRWHRAVASLPATRTSSSTCASTRGRSCSPRQPSPPRSRRPRKRCGSAAGSLAAREDDRPRHPAGRRSPRPRRRRLLRRQRDRRGPDARRVAGDARLAHAVRRRRVRERRRLPRGARGDALLRLSTTSVHEEADVDRCLETYGRVVRT